jgi:hypothetical protein
MRSLIHAERVHAAAERNLTSAAASLRGKEARLRLPQPSNSKIVVLFRDFETYAVLAHPFCCGQRRPRAAKRIEYNFLRCLGEREKQPLNQSAGKHRRVTEPCFFGCLLEVIPDADGIASPFLTAEVVSPGLLLVSFRGAFARVPRTGVLDWDVPYFRRVYIKASVSPTSKRQQIF